MIDKFKPLERAGNYETTTLQLLQDGAFSKATVASDKEMIVSFSKERKWEQDREKWCENNYLSFLLHTSKWEGNGQVPNVIHFTEAIKYVPMKNMAQLTQVWISSIYI